MQRVHLPVFDGVARGRQRLAEHLTAEHACAAQIAALAAERSDPRCARARAASGDRRGSGARPATSSRGDSSARSSSTCPSACRPCRRRRRRTGRRARDHGQLRAVVARFLQANAQVLAHPLDGEAEVELAVVHRLPAVLHLPRLRGAFGDRLDDCGDVEARPCARNSALRRALARRRRSRSG